MIVKNRCTFFKLCCLNITLFFFVPNCSFAQDAADIITLYNTIEQQLRNLRGDVGQLESDVSFYLAEVERLSQNQQQAGSFDQALIIQLRELQIKRDDEIVRLFSSNSLWQKNFAVVNKTFTNIRKKIGV